MAHVSAWERSLLALLRGEPRAAAVGLDKARYELLDTDEINAHIVAEARTRTLAGVRERFLATHDQVVTAVRALSDEQLLLPYSHYQPEDPPHNENPVVGWINGNTWDHYNEHIAWIRALHPRKFGA